MRCFQLRDEVPDFSHTGADLGYLSGNFMSKYQGFADFEIQDSALMAP
jgi:hypothetical protein